MISAVFGKTIENVTKHKNIIPVTTERRRINLVSEPNYCTTKFFTESLLAIEMRKTQILINKPVYLGLWVLDLSETVIHKFWCDYVRLRYGQNVKLRYMAKDGLIVYVKTDGIYKDIAEDVETRFRTSHFKMGRPLPKRKNKNAIELMKDELSGKVM